MTIQLEFSRKMFFNGYQPAHKLWSGFSNLRLVHSDEKNILCSSTAEQILYIRHDIVHMYLDQRSSIPDGTDFGPEIYEHESLFDFDE